PAPPDLHRDRDLRRGPVAARADARGGHRRRRRDRVPRREAPGRGAVPARGVPRVRAVPEADGGFSMSMSDHGELEKKLCGLELEFMRPATRSSRKRLEELIDEDFVAFASTGDSYDRAGTISALLLESPPAWSMVGFEVRVL